MHRERLSLSLLRELYELEDDAYRSALREATRIGWGPPAIALRAVVAHADEALDRLPVLAQARAVEIESLARAAAAGWRRLTRAFGAWDQEQSYRDVLALLRRGIDLVHVIGSAAANEGDDELAIWCEEWQGTRARLVNAAAAELDWFARHPFFSRLTVPAV